MNEFNEFKEFNAQLCIIEKTNFKLFRAFLYLKKKKDKRKLTNSQNNLNQLNNIF